MLSIRLRQFVQQQILEVAYAPLLTWGRDYGVIFFFVRRLVFEVFFLLKIGEAYVFIIFCVLLSHCVVFFCVSVRHWNGYFFLLCFIIWFCSAVIFLLDMETIKDIFSFFNCYLDLCCFANYSLKTGEITGLFSFPKLPFVLCCHYFVIILF